MGRTYLKKFGLLENSSCGVWALSKADIDIIKIDPSHIKRIVREQACLADQITELGTTNQIEKEVIAEADNGEEWKEQLLRILYQITPTAFERLAQRLLRESGFFQVEVTGKVGDGGIDGRGIVRVSGLLSFHVIFQCKRYKDLLHLAKSEILGEPCKDERIKAWSLQQEPLLEKQ